MSAHAPFEGHRRGVHVPPAAIVQHLPVERLLPAIMPAPRSDIAVGDTVRRTRDCDDPECWGAWHRAGWVGVVVKRSESGLTFAGGKFGLIGRYERTTNHEFGSQGE